MKLNKTFTKSTHSLLVASACMLSFAFFTGCTTVTDESGKTSSSYVAGELNALEPVSLDIAWDATLAGMKDMDLLPEAKEKSLTKASTQAFGPEDKIVRVYLTRKNEKVTEVEIRVGIVGDMPFSIQLMEKIRSHY